MYAPERFEALAQELASRSTEIMLRKRREYAPGDEDRLLNFRKVAAFAGLRPSQVALIYLLKHVQSIAEAVQTGVGEWDWEVPGGGEGLKQRFADAINYCFLLAACLDEERTKGEESHA